MDLYSQVINEMQEGVVGKLDKFIFNIKEDS